MNSQKAHDILRTALMYQEGNIPYVYGGNLAKGSFDCSAFMQQIFKDHGYVIPRTSSNQSMCGDEVSEAELLAGDLLFFDRTGEGTVDHVGMYIGWGLMIHTAKQPENINICDWKLRYGKYLKTIRRM